MGKTGEWETKRCAKETGSHVPTTFNGDSSSGDNKTITMPHEPNSNLPRLVSQEDIYKVDSDVLENRLSDNPKYKDEVKRCAETLKNVGDQLEIDYLRRDLIGLNLEGVRDPPPDRGTQTTNRPHSARR
ncbi:uncharacterized protein LOC144882244 [Branchiostoma floridae x Branchiostoma japonicum]